MLNEVLRLTQGDLSMFNQKTPFSQRQENGLGSALPTYAEASEALKKLGEAISEQPKCNHGIWIGTECEECIKEQHAAFRGKHLERERNNEAFYKDHQGEAHE